MFRTELKCTNRDTDGKWVHIDKRVFVKRRVRHLLQVVRLQDITTMTVAQEPALV